MKNLRRSLPPLSSLLPFEAAARLGSLTKAAAELNLTQAAISKQIRALEQDLGTQLFERRNRAVYLTDEGRELGRMVSDALGPIGAHCDALRHKHEGGDVVLRSQLCEGLYWLMPRLSKFYQLHPDVPVRVMVSTRPIPEAEERFDLALQTIGRDIGSAKLVLTGADEVFPVCSPSYLAGLDQPPDLSRLADYRLLHHKVVPQDWVDWDHWLDQLDAPVRVGDAGEAYDSYPMMLQAALEGHGIALGWRRTVENYLSSGALVRPFAGSLSLPDGLSVYQPTDGQQRAGTAVLLEWLKSELS
ncbi:MAG: LysR family transcriptional regulator [Rhizobiales bacterium]|nr:LysR family transcriptional regulator [Hyphomicrobiales bacterium]